MQRATLERQFARQADVGIMRNATGIASFTFAIVMALLWARGLIYADFVSGQIGRYEIDAQSFWGKAQCRTYKKSAKSKRLKFWHRTKPATQYDGHNGTYNILGLGFLARSGNFAVSAPHWLLMLLAVAASIKLRNPSVRFTVRRSATWLACAALIDIAVKALVYVGMVLS